VDSAWEQKKLEARKMLENAAESPASSGRVREWRLGMGLVSIPCHLEPDVRFSLIRLSDNLLLGVFKTFIASAFNNLTHQVRRCMFVFWLSSIARVGILVICFGVIGLPACTVTYFLAKLG
jgi:hypothetical protein